MMNENEHNWCAAAADRGGGFVSMFAHAAMKADDDNFEILQPALKKLMEKYPNYSRGERR